MPWERIGWNEEIQHSIYRDWGLFHLKRGTNLDIAQHYLNKSLEIRANDHRSTYYLSLAKKYGALCEAAYEDAIRALSLLDLHDEINLNVCNILYDMNRLEDAGVEAISKSQKFVGQKVKPFMDKFDVVTENLKDSLGDALSYFIRDYRKYLDVIQEIRKALENPDERPLWKQLRDKNECDILSILDYVEPLVHPREQARLQRGYKIFSTTYLNNSAIDVMFLKSLSKNRTLLLPQFKSTPALKKIVETDYQKVIKFLRMLQARSPLYSEREKKCPKKKLCEREKKASMFRIQNNTRRVCQLMLKEFQDCRKRGNLYELTNSIESLMGDYIILKTNRLLPWKFEFINEVYNTLALAYIDDVVVPDYLDIFKSEEEKLLTMLGLPLHEEEVTMMKFVFGDKRTWTEPEGIDYIYIRYK